MAPGKFINSLARLFCFRRYPTDENLAWKPCGVHDGTATGSCTCGLFTLRNDGFDFNKIEEKLRELLLIEEHSQEQPVADFSGKETEIATDSIRGEEQPCIGSARIFSNDEVQEAIHFFDPVRTLGEGGYGSVYLGKLEDGRMVAVKELKDQSIKERLKFTMEIDIFCNLRHQNLVCLYGCTSGSQEPILVYEYVSNGTVAEHLDVHSKTHSEVLTWYLRLQIAIETAEAITYLHFKPGRLAQPGRQSIIHSDIKTDNILLDDAYHVKVCDFGLSSTYNSLVRGTIGYLDPEYEKDGIITDKSDVYSFGVVLLELVSGQKAVDVNRSDTYLVDLAPNMIRNKELELLVDPNLEYESDSEIRRMTNQVAELACLCLQLERYKRPSMAKVLSNLKKIRDNEDPDIEEPDSSDDVDYASADSSPDQPLSYDLSNIVPMNRRMLEETGIIEVLVKLRSLYGHKLSTLVLFWNFVNYHSEASVNDTSPWGTSCGCRLYLQNSRILEGITTSPCFLGMTGSYIIYLVCLNEMPLHVGQRIVDYILNLFCEKQKLEFLGDQ